MQNKAKKASQDPSEDQEAEDIKPGTWADSWDGEQNIPEKMLLPSSATLKRPLHTEPLPLNLL